MVSLENASPVLGMPSMLETFSLRMLVPRAGGAGSLSTRVNTKAPRSPFFFKLAVYVSTRTSSTQLTTLPSVSPAATVLEVEAGGDPPELHATAPSAATSVKSTRLRDGMLEFNPIHRFGKGTSMSCARWVLRVNHRSVSTWLPFERQPYKISGTGTSTTGQHENAMIRSEALESAHRDRINLSWLVKLRWAATAGQLITIGVVHGIMGIPLPLARLLVLIGLGLATNVAALGWAASARPVAPWAVPALMIFDTLLFTALLHLTGGPFNPFSFLYLVQIALAAVALPARLTWALVLLSLACSGSLFLGYEELPMGPLSHGEHMRIHLVGMWVAFGVAAAFIVHFLLRVTKALAERDAELYEARALVGRQERLASLATLAAGTAHELATPLSTIALAARELDRELADPAALDAAKADAQLIRQEVQRCRAILESMSARGGQFAGETTVKVELSTIVEDAVSELAARPPIRVDLDGIANRFELEAPPRALALTLQNVLKNAQDASQHGQEVVLSAIRAGSRVRIEVRDSGVGMAPEILERVGEPFFTTKPPGGGMGLGLFVSRAMIERLGGELRVSSTLERGTCVTIDLPFAPATSCRTVPAS